MLSYRASACLFVLALFAVLGAHAQDHPTRPVRIVTATPGGGNDYLARIIAPAFGGVLGQQVIVDNRASRLVGGANRLATYALGLHEAQRIVKFRNAVYSTTIRGARK